MPWRDKQGSVIEGTCQRVSHQHPACRVTFGGCVQSPAGCLLPCIGGTNGTAPSSYPRQLPLQKGAQEGADTALAPATVRSGVRRAL